jgi:hypothetical protein
LEGPNLSIYNDTTSEGHERGKIIVIIITTYKEHIFGKEGCQQLQPPLQAHYKSAFIRMYHRSHPLQKMSTVENEEVHFPKKSIQLSSL